MKYFFDNFNIVAGAVILAVLMARRNKKLRHKRKMNINLNDLDKGKLTDWIQFYNAFFIN
jgi:hypothetical protein